MHPDEYAKRLNSLKKDGLKINIFDKNKMKKLGMNALLGVGMGSIREFVLSYHEWNGAKIILNHLHLSAKSDSIPGIPLKPARFMEDMTYDMAGSAAVVGLMKSRWH